jgi:hypothetical protein
MGIFLLQSQEFSVRGLEEVHMGVYLEKGVEILRKEG